MLNLIKLECNGSVRTLPLAFEWAVLFASMFALPDKTSLSRGPVLLRPTVDDEAEFSCFGSKGSLV